MESTSCKCKATYHGFKMQLQVATALICRHCGRYDAVYGHCGVNFCGWQFIFEMYCCWNVVLNQSHHCIVAVLSRDLEPHLNCGVMQLQREFLWLTIYFWNLLQLECGFNAVASLSRRDSFLPFGATPQLGVMQPHWVMQSAIRTMLSTIDPYSGLYPPIIGSYIVLAALFSLIYEYDKLCFQ